MECNDRLDPIVIEHEPTEDEIIIQKMDEIIEALGGGGGCSFCDLSCPKGELRCDDLTETINYMFSGRSGITSLYLPNLETIRGNSFRDMTSLESVYMPKADLITIGNGSIFQNDSSLKGIVLPSATRLGGTMFSGCSSLEYVDVGENCVSITGGNVFDNCTNLDIIILRSPSVVSLTPAGATSFANTPFGSGGSGGEIYIPQALLATYPTEANWSTVDGYGATTWKKIEGSIYETQYADGTPIA